jgi:tetratricopeptide (TPR) repeat protein
MLRDSLPQTDRRISCLMPVQNKNSLSFIKTRTVMKHVSYQYSRTQYFPGLITLVITSLLLSASCHQKKSAPPPQLLSDLQLKRGKVISCGKEQQYGKVEFEISCGRQPNKNFGLGMELLHSFEYDEAEKVFSSMIDQEPGCSMAYWGIAMCNLHLLWTEPSIAELKKGSGALSLARKYTSPGGKELDFINSLSEYYKDWEKKTHQQRTLQLEQAMERLTQKYREDEEASILYSLALVAAADPGDKTYQKQKKAGSILSALYARDPDHPGIIHYIIHTYDYPELASDALPQARKYAVVAPSSAHALHMPSHIFTRLGLWDESISSNLASVSAAKCYAESAAIDGHWDEELHGMDYLVYAWIQEGKNDAARKQIEYLGQIEKVYPINFKTAYAFAAMPARYLLETGDWEGAKNLRIHPINFPWSRFPWQEAIFHFTRLLGAAQLGDLDSANAELSQLKILQGRLYTEGDIYKSRQVEIQVITGEAWILFRSGKKDEGLRLMNKAADLEDSTEKHPVTPGEVIPARELLGRMLLDLNQPGLALAAFQKALAKSPNRRNALHGVQEAEKMIKKNLGKNTVTSVTN